MKLKKAIQFAKEDSVKLSTELKNTNIILINLFTLFFSILYILTSEKNLKDNYKGEK
jgi:hypothetical protein